MSSDFSRKTFDPKKHYSAVQKQQGRVDLDADWNEQHDIFQYRTQTETRDVIGASGVPKKGGSFKVIPKPDASDLSVAPGHMYVGGLLCESEGTQVTYLNQPYYPNPDVSLFDIPTSPPNSPPFLKLKDGTYLVYVDAWQREVNYLDDPRIQEVALGDTDTATRLQNVWQVKLLSVTSATATCKSNITEWNDLILPSTGKLNAQAKKVDDTGNPCVLPPGSGYRGMENQLYRVEIQKGGDLSNTTFKWSRDNASVETKIESVNGSIITVADMGKDEILGFAGSQWVEIVSEESTLKSTPRPLFQVLFVNPAIREITLSASVPADMTGNLKLRRWDQDVPEATADGLPASSGWNDLENGVQVAFSPGTYRAGDYWLIPARVATGEIEWPPYEIPNISPVEQLPLGINHYYCRLALFTVQAGNISNYQDCRPLFPSLTEICAEDICFDNNNCDFPQARNVQEALDLLCAADDLREHNKLLHGLGVICGLKIKCRFTRNGVIIEKGSALDCEGNMIHVKNQNGLPYDLVEKAREKGFIDKDGNGQVCLSIARGANNGAEISIEDFVPQKFWDTVLEGTLLKDFYEDCIKNLIDFFKQQFSFPVTEQVPVPVTQRRLTALLNLFYAAINAKSGPYGFISGNDEQGKPDENEGLGLRPTEDQLLREFYHDLKELLASETFCAMFDKDDPYPEYLLDDGLDTIFGTPLRTHFRLRLHPEGNFAYTCGNNNKVYVYDLGKKELIQSSNFPSDSNIKLQDIALTEKGDRIYGVGIQNDKDSVFAKGIIKPGGLIEWGSPSIKTDSKFVRFAHVSSDRLFGINKSYGLFDIKGIGSPSFSADVLKKFNATGLMVISDETRLVIAAEGESRGTGIESSEFSRLIVIDPRQPVTVVNEIPLSGTDSENDIAIFENIVYATGNNQQGKRVIAAFDLQKEGQQTDEVNIESNSFLRLATYSSNDKEDYLLVTVADALKVVRVRLKKGKMEMDDKFRIPVQLVSMGIAIDGKNHAGYVLNAIVNTLTSMNMHRVFHKSPAPDFTHEPPENLAIYHESAIEAYKDVLSHILQYLKDCFCDKFLVDCPECDEDEKVYLGCVEVRDSKVYNICNFSKRKYVKSFRTVEYWLSTIPILPIVKQAFTKVCCTVFDIKDDKKN
jgi:hypothetical protein